MTAQRLQAPAKLNLTLEVLERRADGYHGVRSLMVPLDLCDEFEISPAAAFHFECDRPSLRDDNLALAAFDALGPRPNIAVTLHKAIPVRAGLGGGSSDAAAVLLAAMSGSFGPPGDRDWLAIARSLGSDVPFFLAGSAALVEGTGERVTAVGALPDWHVLVVKPPVGVSTADAFARIDAAQRPARPRNTSVTLRALNALQRGDFDAMSHCLSNDFQDVVAAAEPAVARTLAALAQAGAAAPLLAGSGACVFALTRTGAQRDEIAARLQLPDEFARLATRFRQAAAWRGSVPA